MTSDTTSTNSTAASGGTTDEAKAAAQDVAGTAKEQAGQVAGETRRQARQLWEQSRDELVQQSGQQQNRLASTLRDLGSELSAMANGPDEGGSATGLVRDVGDQVSSAATWLENKEPGDVLQEVRDFARRKPGTFLLLAAGLGVLGGRLTRGAVDEARDSSDTSGAATTPGYAGQTGTSGMGAPGGTAAAFGSAGTGTSAYADATTPYAGGTTAYAGGDTAYSAEDAPYTGDDAAYATGETGDGTAWTGEVTPGDVATTDPTQGRPAEGLRPRMTEGGTHS